MKTFLLLQLGGCIQAILPKRLLYDPPDQIFALTEGNLTHQSHLVYFKVSAHYPASVILQLLPNIMRRIDSEDEQVRNQIK